MKLLKVTKFLWFDLDFGGFIIGLLTSIYCISQIIYHIYDVYASKSVTSFTELIIATFFQVFASILGLICSVKLIIGLKQRNHQECELFLVYVGMAFVLSVFYIFLETTYIGFLISVVQFFAFGYLCICVYSIYNLLKCERKSKIKDKSTDALTTC